MANVQLNSRLKLVLSQLKLKPKNKKFKSFKTDKEIWKHLIRDRVSEMAYANFNNYINDVYKRDNTAKYFELLAELDLYIEKAHGLVWDAHNNRYIEPYVMQTSYAPHLNLNDLNGVWQIFTSDPQYYDGDPKSKIHKAVFSLCAIVTGKVEIADGCKVYLQLPISKLQGSIHAIPGTKKIYVDLGSETNDRKTVLIGELGASGGDYIEWPRINFCFVNSGYKDITYGVCVLKRCPSMGYNDKQLEPTRLSIADMEKIDISVVEFLRGKYDEYGTQYILPDYEALVTKS